MTRVSASLAQALGAKLPTPAKGSKYGNRKTIVGSLTFDSAKEARRYGELSLLQRAGQISDLALQTRFPLVVDTVTVAHYVADFTYLTASGERVIEDVKSPITRKESTYRLKFKIMAAMGLPVTEV
jgi:hypothetical protein